MLYWNVVIAATITFTCLITPFEVCFLWGLKTPRLLMAFNIVVDISFFIDIVLNFNKAIFLEDTGIYINDRKVIARTYLRGYFAVDMMGTFPWYALVRVFGYDSSGLVKLLKLLKLARLPRSYHVLAPQLLHAVESIVILRYGTIRLFNLISVILLISHFMACFWSAITHMEARDTDNWVSESSFLPSPSPPFPSLPFRSFPFRSLPIQSNPPHCITND